MLRIWDALDTFRAEGKAEGRAEVRAQLLLRLFALRFGELPPQAQALATGAGLEQLAFYGEHVLSAAGLDEVSSKPAHGWHVCAHS